MLIALRSKVAIQQVRSMSGGGGKVMEYFYQGGNDAVVRKMRNLQFQCGGWLEGTKEWGLIWRQTKLPANLNSDLKCSSVKFTTTTGQKLNVWKCQ